MYSCLGVKYKLFLSDFTELELPGSRDILNIKFEENRCSGSRFVSPEGTDGRTDGRTDGDSQTET